MGVGDLPDSALYDAALRGLSAEEVYDRIVTDRRRLRKIATLRGVGLADVLPHRLPRDSTDPVRGVDLDEFYRRSLTDGLAAYQARGRGTIPAGLIQEIRALAHPRCRGTWSWPAGSTIGSRRWNAGVPTRGRAAGRPPPRTSRGLAGTGRLTRRNSARSA